MLQGFNRVFDNMPDICLDVPNAYTLLEEFITVCQKEDFLPESILKDMPQRLVQVVFAHTWMKSPIQKSRFCKQFLNQILDFEKNFRWNLLKMC